MRVAKKRTVHYDDGTACEDNIYVGGVCAMKKLIWKTNEEAFIPNAEERGYDVTIGHGNLLEIERIDELEMFEDDDAATEQAIKDGIPIIPVEELPEDFEFQWLGFIDTEDNRRDIAEYAKKFPIKS